MAPAPLVVPLPITSIDWVGIARLESPDNPQGYSDSMGSRRHFFPDTLDPDGGLFDPWPSIMSWCSPHPGSTP